MSGFAIRWYSVSRHRGGNYNFAFKCFVFEPIWGNLQSIDNQKTKVMQIFFRKKNIVSNVYLAKFKILNFSLKKMTSKMLNFSKYNFGDAI